MVVDGDGGKWKTGEENGGGVKVNQWWSDCLGWWQVRVRKVVMSVLCDADVGGYVVLRQVGVDDRNDGGKW